MEKIFSTKERIKILKAVIFRTELISVNDIANRLGLSKGLISKYFYILVKENIFKKNRKKFSVADSPVVKGIKVMLNISDINVKLFMKYAFVKSVGLYGSCVKGENTEDSDVDIWVRIKKATEEETALLSSQLRRKINRVKVLFLTDEKIEKLKKEDKLFYHALAFGSIILYGDKNGI